MARESKPNPIMSLSDFTESINMTAYGDSGVGKTVLGGTCPNGIFIATENGTISAKRQGSTNDVWPVETWSDVQDAFNYFRRSAEARRKYKEGWIIIDSATAMQALAQRSILDNAVKNDPSRDPDLMQIQDYNKWYNMYKRFVLAFNDLPFNVLYTATTMRREDPEGEDIILPELEGKNNKIANFHCAQSHIVAYLEVRSHEVEKDGKKVREEYRRLLCKNSPPYFAKDRYNVLGRYVRNPNMAEIQERIMSTMGTPSSPARPAKKTARPAAKKTAQPARKATRRPRQATA